MISSEVQRTLVKSPPELWAELSDPSALARHLGELGEIRIVRTEPESTVEWAAQNTTGTISIKPSGWGTKVTLSVTRETVDPQPVPASDIEPASEPTSTAGSQPAASVELEPTASVEPEPEPTASVEREPTATVESGPTAAVEPEAMSFDTETDADTDTEPAADVEPAAEPEVEPEPRRGFFARLFGRRRSPQPATAAPLETTVIEQPLDAPAQSAVAERSPGQPDAFAAVRQALAPETFAASHPFAALPAAKPAPDAITIERLRAEQLGDEAHAEQVSDISVELLAAEDVAAEQVSAEEVTAVLTAVLDRLGAAHHRPFSRA
ncbi:MAG: hypothetical protein ABSB69_14445 [Solirubrobacteraceae bacterium]